MDNLVISEAIADKLREAHGVSRTEVEQAILNRTGKLLIDNRPDHRSDPPTNWFIACTNKGRPLKVVYIQRGSTIYLRSAFEPNETELGIYKRYG